MIISCSFILIKPVDENVTTRNESIYFPLSHYATVLFIGDIEWFIEGLTC